MLYTSSAGLVTFSGSGGVDGYAQLAWWTSCQAPVFYCKSECFAVRIKRRPATSFSHTPTDRKKND